MATTASSGFGVFSFLKGKNLGIRNNARLKAVLLEEWKQLPGEEREKYELIAKQCLVCMKPESPEERPTDLQLKTLKRSIKIITQRCSAFVKSVQRKKMQDSICPVNLPHEEKFACSICSLAYDTSLRSPMCLPCGHTFCASCLCIMSEVSALTCPLDRKFVNFRSATVQLNIGLWEAVGKAMDWAQCKKHGVQVVCFSLVQNRLLCGLCLGEGRSRDIVSLSSAEATTQAEENAQQLWTTMNKTHILLQSLSSADFQLKYYTELLLQKSCTTVHCNAVNKQLAKLVMKLRVQIAASTKELSTHLGYSARVICAVSTMPTWQKLTLKTQAHIPPIQQLEDVLLALKSWVEIRSSNTDNYC